MLCEDLFVFEVLIRLDTSLLKADFNFPYIISNGDYVFVFSPNQPAKLFINSVKPLIVVF